MAPGVRLEAALWVTLRDAALVREALWVRVALRDTVKWVERVGETLALPLGLPEGVGSRVLLGLPLPLPLMLLLPLALPLTLVQAEGEGEERVEREAWGCVGVEAWEVLRVVTALPDACALALSSTPLGVGVPEVVGPAAAQG